MNKYFGEHETVVVKVAELADVIQLWCCASEAPGGMPAVEAIQKMNVPIWTLELAVREQLGRTSEGVPYPTLPFNRDEADFQQEGLDPDVMKKAQALLGKQVEILLAVEDGERHVAKGKLLAFSDDGEVKYQDEMYAVWSCWPMLRIREVE